MITAYGRGHEAGLNREEKINPYEPDQPEFSEWEEGYDQGRVDADDDEG